MYLIYNLYIYICR